MPLDPAAFYELAMGAADGDGRLALSRMTGWEIFPFERDGLRVVRLDEPQLPEPPRHGEGGKACRACGGEDSGIWSNEHWKLSVFDSTSGAPLVMMLQSREHFDLTDLPDERAAEMGQLIVRIARAIEGLPHIARAHVSRWGDGGAHLHIFFFARPAGFPQLRGTCFALWDDLLPATPLDIRDGDAAAVVAALNGA
jgi:diadenosine tetraphosphate (Ap4A) HIT family hydrolase